MSTEVKARSTDSGVVIGPEADVAGLGGVFDHLMNEHGEVARLIGLVFAAKSAEERKNLYPALRTHLLAHERCERAVLYATLQQFPATQTMVEEHAQQLSELEIMVEKLDSAPVHSDEWLQHLVLLSVLFRRHVRQEEDEFFPRARDALGWQTSHELRDNYLHAKLGIVNTIEAEFRPNQVHIR